MSSNRQRFWTVLSKWPITLPNKEYDYGFRLRELLKNKSEIEDIFPGTPAENSRKMDSLVKLVNNCAKNEFPSKAVKGVCGFELRELKKYIEDHISEKKLT